MSYIYIDAETANDLRFEEEVEDFVVVHRETGDLHRWESDERVVFKCCEDHPRFFEFWFRAPLTECQEYEDFTESVPCKEVFPIEKTVVVYE